MRKPIPIDLLIFDFDGTLADSIPSAVDAIQSMIVELNLPHKTREEIHRHVGFGEIPLVSGSIGSDDPALLQRATEVYYKRYLQDGIKTILLYPHVREFLDHFKNKIKVIISNKSDRFIRLILENHGLLNHFQEILGGDTAPCLKPDPCVIKRLMDEHKIPPRRVIFIGDMTIDIETGKNAGVLTCGLTYGFDGREKLKKMGPDFLVDDLMELKELIV